MHKYKDCILLRSNDKLAVQNVIIPTPVQSDELRNFTADFHAGIFNINYPALKEYDVTQSMSDQRNINGYPRYYTDLYTIQKKRFLLCNHRVEELSRSYFEAWLNHIRLQ